MHQSIVVSIRIIRVTLRWVVGLELIYECLHLIDRSPDELGLLLRNVNIRRNIIPRRFALANHLQAVVELAWQIDPQPGRLLLHHPNPWRRETETLCDLVKLELEFGTAHGFEPHHPDPQLKKSQISSPPQPPNPPRISTPHNMLYGKCLVSHILKFTSLDHSSTELLQEFPNLCLLSCSARCDRIATASRKALRAHAAPQPS